MPDYKEYNCPVCNRQFEDDDDIVTCPECGTPHHRDCYNLTGHCVNRGLHAADYSFLDEQKKANSENIVEEAMKERISNTVSADDESRQEDAEKKPFSDIADLIMPEPVQTKYDGNSSTIDGYEIGDIAATVRTNIDAFIAKFQKQSEKGKKTGWNWGAFFFGSLYMFFRKMYKQGFVFLILFVSTILISNALMVKMAPDYMNALQEFANAYMQDAYKNSQEMMEAVNSISKVADAQTAVMIGYITYGVILLIRVIAGLFSDYFYKQTVYGTIKSVTDLLNNGASFTQTPLFAPQQSELSQSQMKKMYLSNKGGVSILTPMLVVSTVYLLLNIIS